MKKFFMVLPLTLALVIGTVRADDEKEWTVEVGCAHCAFEKETGAKGCAAAAKAGDKVYVLKGNVAKDFKKGGTYIVKGKMTDDKTIEVKEMTKKS